MGGGDHDAHQARCRQCACDSPRHFALLRTTLWFVSTYDEKSCANSTAFSIRSFELEPEAKPHQPQTQARAASSARRRGCRPIDTASAGCTFRCRSDYSEA